jgi:VWFA-related protein
MRIMAAGVFASALVLAGVPDSARVASQDAQQSTPAQPVFRTGVETVTVDVQVIDRTGQPVADLAAGDFTLTVDGKPRQLASAQFVRFVEADGAGTRAAAAATPAGATERGFGSNEGVATGRLIVLVVDQGNLTRGGGRGAMEAATRFVDRLTPADRVALLTVPVGPSLEFTNDAPALKTALLKIVGGGALEYIGTGSFGLSLSESFAFVTGQQRRLWNEAVSLECAYARSESELQNCIAELEGLARSKVATAKTSASISLQALRNLMRRLATVDGPKQVVLVGQALVTGTEFGDLDLMAEVNDLGALAQAARVTLSVLHVDRAFLEAFDVKERYATRTLVQDVRLLSDGLVQTAGAAGGAYYSLPVNFDAAFDRIARETSAAYELGFETIEADRDGRTHRIEVKVSRPDVTVRSRRSFVAGRPAPAAQPETAGTVAAAGPGAQATAEAKVARLLESPVPRTALPLRVRTHALAEPGGDRVRLLLAAEVGRDFEAAATVVVGYLLRAPGGAVAGRTVETAALHPVGSGGGRSLYYSTVLVVPEGDYLLRLAVLDTGERAGVLEVPVTARWEASGGYLLSDPLLSEPGVRAGGRITMNVDGRVTGRELGVYAEARLAAGAPAATAPPMLRFDVVSAADGAVLIGRQARATAESAAGRWFAETTLDLASLVQGRYVLRVAAIDPATGETNGGLARTLIVRPPE